MNSHEIAPVGQPSPVLVPAQEPDAKPLRPQASGRSAARKWLWASLALVVCLSVGYGGHRHWRRAQVRALHQQCAKLGAANDWNALASVAAEWAALEPQRADPWIYRAQAAEELKDWAEMVAYLDRVPRSDSRAIGALVRKAITEFEKLNRPWDGIKTCDAVLALDERVLIAHKQSIFFCAMTLQRAELVRRVRRAIQLRRESPESYVYLVGASWLYMGSVYRHNSHWLGADPENETFQVARALQVYVGEVKSDLEQAAQFEHIPPDEELLRKYPHNQELVAYFLNRCISEGDVERVRGLLEAVPAQLAEQDPRFWRARAWCEDAGGDLEAAEKS